MESKQEEQFMLKQAEEELKKKQEEQKEGKSEASKAEKAAEKKTEAKQEIAKKEEKKEEKKREIVLERLYTIPIKRILHDRARMKRHKRHASVVRKFAAKHMKAEHDKVKIAANAAMALTKTGKNKMLRSLKVKISKDKEGIVLVELAA